MFKQSRFLNQLLTKFNTTMLISISAIIISGNAHSQASGLTKKVDVFGIPVYATAKVDDKKVLHAAKVMAEYLDNNSDGQPDNPSVVQQMLNKKAYLFMAANETEQENLTLPAGEGQNLFATETHPQGSTIAGGFDATLEEVLHLISHVGYANAYPSAFGESGTTLLTQAMDVARGGKFLTIPTSYPANAWYTYNDSTCDYSCMSTEYFYWALTSMLGAQAYSGRLADISQEWKLNTKTKVMSTDTMGYNLLTNPLYKLPTKLPDGSYDAVKLKITKTGGSGSGSTLNKKKVERCSKRFFRKLARLTKGEDAPISLIPWNKIERRLAKRCLK